LHKRTNWKRLGRIQSQVLRLLVYRGPLRTCQLRTLIYGRRGRAMGGWFEYLSIDRAARKHAHKRDGVWVLREG
jgi:hypothetical protein